MSETIYENNNLTKNSNRNPNSISSNNGKSRNNRNNRNNSGLIIVFAIILIPVIIISYFHLFTDKEKLRDEALKDYKSMNYDLAIANFDKALECKQWFSENVDADILLYKADCYIKTSEYHKAYDVYELLLSSYSNKYYNEKEVQFLSNLSINLDLYAHGNYDTQADFFASAVERGYDEISLYAADCYGRKGDLDNMIKYYDIYTSKYGFTTFIAYKYVSYYMGKEEYIKALSCIESYINVDDEYSKELMYSEIICYLKLNDYEKALKFADKYLKAYKDDEEAKTLRDFINTKVNVNTHVVNDIYNLNKDDNTYIIGE